MSNSRLEEIRQLAIFSLQSENLAQMVDVNVYSTGPSEDFPLGSSHVVIDVSATEQALADLSARKIREGAINRKIYVSGEDGNKVFSTIAAKIATPPSESSNRDAMMVAGVLVGVAVLLFILV